MARKITVVLRLAPGMPPTTLVFTAKEHAYLESSFQAQSLYSSLSEMIRSLSIEAARRTSRSKLADWGKVHEAAKRCEMPLATWMRFITLAAIGYSPLLEQMIAARKKFIA